MIFDFTKEDFDILEKYGDFEDLKRPYNLMRETNQIEIDQEDVINFQCIIDDISVIYGMTDNQNRMTDFGYKVLAIYDKVYHQIHGLS